MRLKITNGMNIERKKVSTVKISKVMLHNRLNEAGYRYCKAKSKPNLTVRQMQVRL